MKQLFLSLLFFSVFNSCTIGQQKINSEALFLNHKQVYKTYLTPDSTSPIKYIVPNDSINEEYFIAILKDSKEGWMKISAYSPDTAIRAEGWIQSKYLIIKTASYSNPFILFSSPTTDSREIKIMDYNFESFSVIDFSSGWLKVKYKDYVGWLEPSRQCSNPYTTCN